MGEPMTTHGGARSRSGPLPREDSARSKRRGYRLNLLPTEAYDGPIPAWPLAEASPRELEVWEQSWRLPQGHLWAMPEQSWRHRTVAMWVRQAVRCEASDVGAAQLAQLHRFADQAGMTDAGLAAIGWKVDAEPRVEPTGQAPERLAKVTSLERARLRAEGA